MKTLKTLVAVAALTVGLTAQAGYIENVGSGAIVRYEQKCYAAFTPLGKAIAKDARKVRYSEGYYDGVDLANSLSCNELKDAWVEAGIYSTVFKY